MLCKHEVVGSNPITSTGNNFDDGTDVKIRLHNFNLCNPFEICVISVYSDFMSEQTQKFFDNCILVDEKK